MYDTLAKEVAKFEKPSQCAHRRDAVPLAYPPHKRPHLPASHTGNRGNTHGWKKR